MASRITRSPTVQTLLAFLVVFVVSYPLQYLGLFRALFTLSTPVVLNPWAIVTSVYSHASVGHLLANSIALVFVGIPLERATRTWAFHAYFVVTGAVAGLSQVYVAGLLGLVGVGAGNVAVLGASGAVFAVGGYVVAGNFVTDGILKRLNLSAEALVVIFVVLAAVVTWATAAPGVALVAHFTGLLIGLFAGRIGILPERKRRGRTDPVGHP